MSENLEIVTNNLVDAIRKHARLAVIAGIVMVVCGALAVGSPFAAGLSVTLFVGAFMAVGGISQCLFAFRAGAFGKGLLIFLVGALTTAAGIVIFTQPVAGLASITLLLAAYFIVSGIFEVIAGLQSRPAHGWGWLLTAGIVTLLLGGMIWNQFPLSGAWAVGVLFGIRLMMSGWWLIAIGRSVRTVAGGIQP